MNQPSAITLTMSEMRVGAEIGVQRHMNGLRAARKDKYGCSPDVHWDIDIEGACGEMAVAKLLGMYWNGAIGNINSDDVGPLQVRTASRDHYCLIVHDDDANDKKFILVTGRSPVFQVRGWIKASDAKRPEFWKDPVGDRPAFFVPQDRLRPMSELRASNEPAP